jgi:hypothetical protein
VNKRLKKAVISRENGSLGGRPKKAETQKTQHDNLKRKRIESEIYGSGDKVIYIRSSYANEAVKEIHKLEPYFEHTKQLQSFLDAGWIYFDAFMEENPGKVFDDHDHLYNTFRNFSNRYTPPARAPDKFKDAAWDKGLWTLEAWEEAYKYKLQHDDEFREHFGYGKLSVSKSVGS